MKSTYENILGVLELSLCDDSGSDHKLFPGLCQVKVVYAISGAFVDVSFHLLGDVLSSDVNFSSDHLNEVLFSVIGVQKGHSELGKLPSLK